MVQIQGLVQEQEDTGDPRGSKKVVGPADHFGENVEGQHDQRAENGGTHAHHFSIQDHGQDGQCPAGRQRDPEFCGQRKKAHAEEGQMDTADAQDMDHPGTLVQFFCLFLKQAFFSEEHGFEDRRIPR